MEYKKLKNILMTQQFSEKELAEIKAIADVRMGSFSAKQSGEKELEKRYSFSDTFDHLFYEALGKVLRKECDINILPFSKLKKVQPKVYKEVCKCSEYLYSVSEKWNSQKSNTKPFTYSVYFLYCNLVVRYLRQYRIPVSLRTCLQHSEKFEGMVDKSFPGYIQNGCISIILEPKNYAISGQ